MSVSLVIDVVVVVVVGIACCATIKNTHSFSGSDKGEFHLGLLRVHSI